MATINPMTDPSSPFPPREPVEASLPGAAAECGGGSGNSFHDATRNASPEDFAAMDAALAQAMLIDPRIALDEIERAEARLNAESPTNP